MFEKIMIVFSILIVVAIILVIAGALIGVFKNEANRIAEGVVIDKYFDSGYTSTSSSKDSGISIYHHPASYNLLIEGRKDGQVVQYWKEVTAEEYAKYNIGDYYGHE